MSDVAAQLTKALLARSFPAMVAQVLNPFTLVMNRGADDNVKVGQRFLVYAIGEDVIDPETRQTLGKLEVVRGTGVVDHLQPKLAVLKSDRKNVPQRRVVKKQPMLPFATEETVFEDPVAVDFDYPEVGDLVKPV